MIKRLRWKMVGINMAIVTAVLLTEIGRAHV